MASALRRGMFQNQLVTGEHTLGGSTSNLVRLLREAEEGKGLGSDYVEALQETLAVQQDIGGDMNTKRRGGRRQERTVPFLRMKT